MKALGQLIDNLCLVCYDIRNPNKTIVEIMAAEKAAQEAIVKHVEGAMIDAMVFGRSAEYSVEGAVQEKWEKLLGEWTK